MKIMRPLEIFLRYGKREEHDPPVFSGFATAPDFLDGRLVCAEIWIFIKGRSRMSHLGSGGELTLEVEVETIYLARF